MDRFLQEGGDAAAYQHALVLSSMLHVGCCNTAVVLRLVHSFIEAAVVASKAIATPAAAGDYATDGPAPRPHSLNTALESPAADVSHKRQTTDVAALDTPSDEA